MFTIPVKSEKEASIAVASLFEEFIATEKLRFYVKKLEDNKFLSFAYDESKIVDAIKKSGISNSQINNIYFAQTELEEILKEKNILNIEGINLTLSQNQVVLIPSSISVEKKEDFSFEGFSVSKNKIPLNLSSKYISVKTSYTMSVIFVLFAVLNYSKAVDNFYYGSDIPKQIEQLKKSVNLPATMIQTRSIISKLTQTATSQKELREFFEYIFTVKSKTNAQMVGCDYKNGSFELKFKTDFAKSVTDYLEKKYTLTSAVVKDGIVTIGIKQ